LFNNNEITVISTTDLINREDEAGKGLFVHRNGYMLTILH